MHAMPVKCSVWRILPLLLASSLFLTIVRKLHSLHRFKRASWGTRLTVCRPRSGPFRGVLGDGSAAGQADETGAANPLGALIARLMRVPLTGHYSIHVAFTERGGIEHWTYWFGSKCFTSELSEKDGHLVERFEPARFQFDLPADETGLTMVMRCWLLVNIRLPLALAPQSPAREWERGGAFHFDVPIGLPLMELIVPHHGVLQTH